MDFYISLALIIPVKVSVIFLIVELYKGRYLDYDNVKRILEFNDGELKIESKGILKVKTINFEGFEISYKFEFLYDGELYESYTPGFTGNSNHIKFSKPWSKDIAKALRLAKKEMVKKEKLKKHKGKQELNRILEEKRRKYR